MLSLEAALWNVKLNLAGENNAGAGAATDASYATGKQSTEQTKSSHHKVTVSPGAIAVPGSKNRSVARRILPPASKLPTRIGGYNYLILRVTTLPRHDA
jgi:hypothetical protein